MKYLIALYFASFRIDSFRLADCHWLFRFVSFSFVSICLVSIRFADFFAHLFADDGGDDEAIVGDGAGDIPRRVHNPEQ